MDGLNFYRRPVYERNALADSIDVSTMKVLKESFESQDKKNIVLSPLGVMILLSLYNQGAGPAASTQVTTFLGGTDAKETMAAFKELSAKLAAINPAHLSVANKMAVTNQYALTDTFAAAVRDVDSEVDLVDFTKTEDVAAKINKWAAEKTMGHITNPVNKDSLTSDMAVALFNVIFFKGEWHVPFKVKDTKMKNFYLSKTNVTKKEMMHLLQPLYYTASKELGAKIIELPYKQQGFRMVVVLPNEVDGLPSVLEKAAMKGLLPSVSKLCSTNCDVDLRIPKFDIRTKLDLKNVLEKVGVGEIFEEPAPGVLKGKPVKVSKVFQEAFIEVNEEGATAGAFTGLCYVPMSAKFKPPPPLKFKVDHPFLYVILHEDKILFAGTYSG